MPQFKPPVYDVMIDAPDEIFSASTTLKRKIKAGALHIDYPKKQVVIEYTVHYFVKNDDGSYGDSLESRFPAREGRFVANNDSIVTTQGGVLGNIINYYFDADGNLAPETRIRLWGSTESISIAEAEAAAQEEEVIPSEVEGEPDIVIPAKPAGPLNGVNWMREWDFYFFTSENYPVKVGDLIRGTFMNAIVGGRI